MRCRIEKDELGEVSIPKEAYYGIAAVRSKETFRLTKHGLSRQMIKALALIKKAAACAAADSGLIDPNISDAVCRSADEILNGRLHGQFITDVLQDGYGYGMDLNTAEVICNRANEMLGSEKGKYDKVKVSEVNYFQDIKETSVLAGKLAAVKLIKKLISENKKTISAILKKTEECENKENSPISMELESIAEILQRDTKRVDKAMESLLIFGYGKAVALPDDRKEIYLASFLRNLNGNTTEKYQLRKNRLTAGNNLDCFMNLSATVKNLMIDFSCCMSDLKALTKEGKLRFPKVQDVDVPPEDLLFDFVKQVSFYIVGNDLTVARAIEAGTMDENPFIPIILASLFESINLVRRAIRTIKENVFEVMTIS